MNLLWIKIILSDSNLETVIIGCITNLIFLAVIAFWKTLRRLMASIVKKVKFGHTKRSCMVKSNYHYYRYIKLHLTLCYITLLALIIILVFFKVNGQVSIILYIILSLCVFILIYLYSLWYLGNKELQKKYM